MAGSTQEPDACFKNQMLRDIQAHQEKLLQLIKENYSIAENSVDILLKNQSAPNFLKRYKETYTFLQECQFKLEKLAECAEDILVSGKSKGNFKSTPPTVPLQDVCFGKQYLVELLFNGTPSRFWLQLANSSNSLLEKDLAICYKEKKPLTVKPAVGEFVVVLGPNKVYCRGKVVDICTDESFNCTRFELMLIDYGNSIITSLVQMYAIEEPFCSQPANGMLCSLYGLSSVTGCWGLDAAHFFLSNCHNLVATFHPVTQNEKRESFSIHQSDYSVTLFNKDPTGELIDLGRLLIAEGFGMESVLQVKEQIQSSQCDIPESMINSQQILPLSLPKLIHAPRSPSLHSKPTEALIVTSPSSRLSFCDTSKTHQPKSLNPAAVTEFYPVDSKLPKSIPPLRPPPTFPLRHRSKDVKSLILRGAVSQSLHSSQGTPPIITSASQPAIFQSSTKSNSSVRLPNLTSPVFPLIRSTVKQFKQPAAHKSSSELAQESETQPVEEPHRNSPDPQLMSKFLSSLRYAESQGPPSSQTCAGVNSLVASSPFHDSEQPKSLFGRFDAACDLKNSAFLDYAFGAELKSRTLLPFLTTGEMIFLPASIISPSHFYVYPIDETSSKLIILEERLNDLYSHSNSAGVTQPEIGSCWVIQERNRNWSRVRVTNLDLDHQTVDVDFVDYGGNGKVETSKLHPLIREIVDIPCLAVRCRLGGICPKEHKNSELWTQSSCRKLFEFFGDGQFNAIVVSPLGKTGELSLIVFDASCNEEGKTINQILVDVGEASFNISMKEALGPQTIHSKEPSDGLQEWNPMEEDFHSYKNNLALDTENYDSVTAGYTPQDDKKICRFFLSSGKCLHGIKCNQLHSKPNKHMFTADEQEFFVDLPEEPLPSPGSIICVGVSCVNSPFSMYVVLPHGTRDLRYARAEIDEPETLETLQEALQEEYTVNFHQHRYSFSPALSDIVVARSSYDKMWYRGRVMADDKDDYYVIFFLDFGNVEVVHLKNLCRFLPRFSHLPKQAIEVFLNGIDIEGNHSEEGKKQLIKLVEDKDLVAEVVSLWPYLSINLYDITGPNHIDIAKELIASKVVKTGFKSPVRNTSSLNMIPG